MLLHGKHAHEVGSLIFLLASSSVLMAPSWYAVRRGSAEAYTELVLAQRQNDQHTIVFRALFSEPVVSTVSTRGRRTYSKLPPADASQFRMLQETCFVSAGPVDHFMCVTALAYPF